MARRRHVRKILDQTDEEERPARRSKPGQRIDAQARLVLSGHRAALIRRYAVLGEVQRLYLPGPHEPASGAGAGSFLRSSVFNAYTKSPSALLSTGSSTDPAIA